MDFIIRKATENDYSDIARLYDELNRLHGTALPHIFLIAEKTPQTLEYISNIIKNDEAVLFVAQSGWEIIGFIQAMIRQSPDYPNVVKRKYAYIDDICVKQECRRSSVGKKLMEAVEKWAVKNELDQIELNVWDFNKRAMAFFAGAGYTPYHHVMAKSLRKNG